MKQNLNGSETAQGAEFDEKQVPELDQIQKWIKDDIGRSLSLLNAIYQDTELQQQMAIFLQGRVINFKNKPDPAQTDLFRK